jgi:hypothetical protein
MSNSQEAGDYFYGLFEESSGRLLGFVNGTCTAHSDLTHETMST